MARSNAATSIRHRSDATEHYIPITKRGLVDALIVEGLPSKATEAQFRALVEMLSATYHFEFHKTHSDLLELYLPFNPDDDVIDQGDLGREERVELLVDLKARFNDLLLRANFTLLDGDKLKESLQLNTGIGINITVDTDLYEEFVVHTRGAGFALEDKRVKWKPWKKESVEVPVYSRLVVLMLAKPTKKEPDPNLYLKVFKDVPVNGVEMVFPEVSIRMKMFDKFKLGGTLGASIIAGVVKGVKFLFLGTVGVIAMVGLVIGYMAKTVIGFFRTKERYSTTLRSNLYYRSLDTNEGVFAYLVSHAELECLQESFLAYAFLDGRPEGMTGPELDKTIEEFVERRFGLRIDFDVDDGLSELERLGLLHREGTIYKVPPINEALRRLDERWDGYFLYNGLFEPLNGGDVAVSPSDLA